MNSLKNIIDSLLQFVASFTEKSYCVCKDCGKEWKTKLVNGEKVYDLKAKCDCGCKEYQNRYLVENNDFVIQVLQDLAKAYKTEIHEYLAPSNLPDKEKRIRDHIRDIMTRVKPIAEGRLDYFTNQYTKWYNKGVAELQKGANKSKYKSRKEIPIQDFSPEIQQQLKTYKEYVDIFKGLVEDYTALVAFRHFETFCMYIDNIFGNDIFKPSIRLFKGFYYYANKMVLDGDVKFIEKQCFAGAGKSITDCALICWILGIDINTDVLKIFGNDENIQNAMDTITQIMCSPYYAKVFPYFEKFNGNKNDMFSKLKEASGDLKISGSLKTLNLRVKSKGEAIDGVRANYLFLDDINTPDDTLEKYKKAIHLYNARWRKRRYDDNHFYIIASGTTYHREDFLSYLKEKFGADYATPSPFEFTSIARTNQITPNGISVFCVIYGLDENDKSTYEKKFTTQLFLNEREDDYRTFMAMTQQQPLPPEGAPFDYDNLPNLYGEEGIPHLPDRLQEVCRASLDPARKGKDFNSMPIIVTINGEMYLQDCIFNNDPPDKLPNQIVDMIEKHHIVELDIENNTDTTFDLLIKKILKERGIMYCNVTSFYSYEKKDQKIKNYETAIKSIHYPERDVYSRNSPMGNFMYWFTNYDYEHPPKHDDSVDSLANYSQRFIVNKPTGVQIKTYSRRKHY